jgi:peptidyl-prolyl cis-trans isomerase B (cyclophilin B)
MKNVIFGLICGSLLVLGVTPFVSASSIFDSMDHRDLVAMIETSSGTVIIDVFYDDAPNHAENFLSLIDSGFYEQTFFHRIIKDFMIQGGDPNTRKTTGEIHGGTVYDEESEAKRGTLDFFSDKPATTWGQGGPDERLVAEFNDIKHNRGIVSMARSADPDSAGSQFFIVHKNSNFLDTEYTVFGRIVTQESFVTLDRIAGLKLLGETPENPEQTRITSTQVMKRVSVHNYLPLGPVERIGDDVKTDVFNPADGQIYKSMNHGIQFEIPPGWTVQEPPKTHENSPDIVVLGSQTNAIPDSLTVTIRNTEGKTFDQLQTEKINQLQPRIDAGALDLKFTGVDEVSGRDVFSLYAQGLFIKNTGDSFTPEETIDILFAEVLIYDTPKHYIISTASERLQGFDKQVENLEKAVYTFAILSDEQALVAGGSNALEVNEEGGGCLIATAAYGSEMAPQVQFLRELRDNTVLQTQSGTTFMTGFNQFYYSFSPVIADYERENPVFKEAVKVTLTPLLTSLTLLNYVDIETEQEMLGYGIGVILLNIGMYFVAPAAVIIAIKNRRK